MNVDNETTIATTGRGLVFFNEDGSCGGYVRDSNGEQRTVRGRITDGLVSLTGNGVSVQYRRVDQPSERHPVGRGTMLFDGDSQAISVFHARTEDGRRVHGLSLATLPAATDAPF